MNDETMYLLLVEDNPGDRRLIYEMLTDARGVQFDLTYVGTLHEGMARVEQHHYDAILLDLSLPDSQGVGTLTKMREAAPHIAIIVLTGLDDQTMGVQAVQAGAQDYLVKGDAETRLLTRTIQYAIERHRNEVKLRRSEEEYRSLINDVFDTSNVAVLILDRQFTIVWCNVATEIYFGLQRQAILGMDKRVLVEETLMCSFEDPDTFAKSLRDAYAAGTFTTRLECHVMPEEDRQERWLEYWSQPIRSGMYEGGRIEQYTDITNRKRFEIAEQEQRLFAEALRDTTNLITSTMQLDEVLERIQIAMDRVVPHDNANIVLLENNRIQIIRHRETPVSEPLDYTSQTLSQSSLLLRMYHTQQPVTIADMTLIGMDVFGMPLAPEDLSRAYIGVPIILREQVIGFINAFSRRPNHFGTRETEQLMAFAQQTAIAIENARLFKESRELAAVQERQRLARDLHDSVSQTLFTTSAMAESALRQWDNPVKAYRLLEDVHKMSKTALAEMRLLLLELRPASLTKVSLKQLLEQYLQPIQVRRGIEITLDVPDDLRLPAPVQIGLYRVVQEAFNNIDKHAQATQVYATVLVSDACIELVIRDNGRGFDASDIGVTSLGLQIIHERAEEMGATADIQSQPGNGTRISVSVPTSSLLKE